MINFMNICRGHENFDIARTIYLTEIAPVPESAPNKEMVLELKKKAADLYLKEMGVDRECLSAWLTIIAAARLSELSGDQMIEKDVIMQYLAARGF